jgi:nucleoside-diphosphate-sugar epimerase
MKQQIFGSRLHLVTGGAGFIGSHIVQRLLEEGHRVRVIDNFSTGLRERLDGLLGHLELLEESVTEPQACSAAVHGVDTVFHEAALPSVLRSLEDPLSSHSVNATGTLNLLLAARDAEVRRFVYAGSSSAYGDTDMLPKSEELPALPQSPYAAAKLSGEHYCRLFSRLFGLETVVLRYFNVFGPGQDPSAQYAAVIPRFIAAALAGESPTINGDGEQTRDFTFVRNVVDANLRASVAPAGQVSGEVFNIGCGKRTSINLLWRIIAELSEASVAPSHTSPRPGDVRDSLADVHKASDRFGYAPSVSLEEGLRATVRWFRDSPTVRRIGGV